MIVVLMLAAVLVIWGMNRYQDGQRKGFVIASLEGKDETFLLDLTDKTEATAEEWKGETFGITGIKDGCRGYFEGEIDWKGQPIFFVDLATADYVVARGGMEPFLVGDYYVSCRHDESGEKLQILIFYCPA